MLDVAAGNGNATLAAARRFADASFDAVLSTFGVMFTADHDRAAAEMLRVCRRGGRIGLANWTPNGFVGRLFQLVGRYVPPPPGAKPPASWGVAHWIDVFRTYYGPANKAFAALDAKGQLDSEKELVALLRSFDVSGGGSLVVPSDYLEVVLVRA